jgi:diguanylate cyclase (GGDEF)-like protein
VHALGSTVPTTRSQVPMTFLTWMQPRDHPAAARTVSTLCAVAVVITVLFAPLAPRSTQPGPWAIGLAAATIVLVGALSLLARLFDEANEVAWAACPLLAVAAIVVVDLLTHDATVSAQIFFLFPTLYGASLLPRPGAVLMTLASLAGELVVVVAHLPLRDAVTDAGYVAAVLVTTAVLLTRASERQVELVASLERQAAIDPLTGLVTRRVLDEAATSALTGAASDEGTSLVLLDVDAFKSVNDRYGHPGGDQVLVQLAELLGSRSRRGDVVCRMGGDEIALLLPGCAAESAQRRAEQILADVRAHAFTVSEAQTVRISVSVGVAHAPTRAADLRTLYAGADAALYEAKQAGRDRVVAPVH